MEKDFIVDLRRPLETPKPEADVGPDSGVEQLRLNGIDHLEECGGIALVPESDKCFETLEEHHIDVTAPRPLDRAGGVSRRGNRHPLEKLHKNWHRELAENVNDVVQGGSDARI
jgi:hypothetical protein